MPRMNNGFSLGRPMVAKVFSFSKYRLGSRECVGCPHHSACGGFLAITASLGGDPFCFRGGLYLGQTLI
jgi:hypothetical protein